MMKSVKVNWWNWSRGAHGLSFDYGWCGDDVESVMPPTGRKSKIAESGQMCLLFGRFGI